MAVEAPHLNPQIPISNREFEFGSPIGYGVGNPAAEFVVPFYGSSAITTTVAPVKHPPAMKTDCVPMKRSRDAIDSLLLSFPGGGGGGGGGGDVQNANQRYGCFNFIGEDVSFQIQQYQLETERLIAQHHERVRLEIEDRRKRYCRRLAAAVEENIMKRLKAKDEEIEQMEKLNSMLQERLKSLVIENRIWRDLAHTNQATANALRSDLAQLLDKIQSQPPAGDLIDDAESSCSSDAAGKNRRKACRRCDREESCVLLLPCRHLCVCTACGSSTQTCPICHSTKTATLHINLSN